MAVVTGATGGIGRWIALGLARAGMRVVLVGRDAGRGEAALGWVRGQVRGCRAELMLADLSSLADTRALGERIGRAHPEVAVLVNNAGVFRARRTETPEGHEHVLAVNHLSPFVLTGALEPALLAAGGRLVQVGSSTSDRAGIDPARLELERGWTFTRAYGRSKLATLMVTMGWAARWAGTGTVAHTVHPGTVGTGLVRTPGVIGLAWKLMKPWSRTEEQGAAVPLGVALEPRWGEVSGCYVKDGRAARPNPLAEDAALRARVWAETERLVSGEPR